MKQRPSKGVISGVLLGLCSLIATSKTARAHVKYVTEGGDPIDAVHFLSEALSEPTTAFVLVGSAIAVVAVIAVYLHFRPAARDITLFRNTLSEYKDLLPWLLRLSIGLPLVGAGFAGYFFTPVVATPTRLFEVAVGFLLLFGLATRFVAGVGFLGYLVGLVFHPELLLAAEYVPGFIAIILLGGGRPSADHVLARIAATDGTLYARIDPIYRRLSIPFARMVEPYTLYVPTVLRAGLGFTFFYLGFTQKLMNPGDALAVVAQYDLTAVVPVSPELWVLGAGLVEMAIGVTLLFGVFTRASAGVAFVMFTTTLFGLPNDPVLAHISLFGLVSVLLVTGSGPFALDEWMETSEVETQAAPAD
ncbi:DoxX family protein [Halococcus salifodinae]|uniref:DoxX family protein n=1 Tax=Halococcus salifodinae TaxID=36738 RepID=UPI000677F1E3|nr:MULTISPECIES: DoxX family protein [Halococcus]